MQPFTIQSIDGLELLSSTNPPRWLVLDMPIGSGRSTQTAKYLAKEGHTFIWITPCKAGLQVPEDRVILPTSEFNKLCLPHGTIIVVDEFRRMNSTFFTKLRALVENNPSALLLSLVTSTSTVRDSITHVVRDFCDGTFGCPDSPTKWNLVEGKDPQELINALVDVLEGGPNPTIERLRTLICPRT